MGSGAPGDRTTEAAAGAYWLRHNGVKRSAIISIPIGRDTRTQTVAYVNEMKKHKLSDVIIATDPYHCNRAISMAKDLGVVATCSPVQEGPNSLKNSRLRYMVREAGAYLAYISLGRLGLSITDHLPNSPMSMKGL